MFLSFYVRISILFSLFLLALPLPASPDISFRAEIDKRIIQRIEWEKDNSAYNYLIEIERQNGSEWANAVSEVTENNFVEVSLEHGDYRYRVTPSDLLGRRRPPASWSRLAVLRIFQPELASFSPSIFYLDDAAASKNYVLEVTGNNLLPESTVYLRRTNKTVKTATYTPAEDGKSASLAYNKNDLSDGLYDIVIENPGGLQAVLPNFRVGEGRFSRSGGGLLPAPEVFYLSEGYAPFIPFPGVFNNYFGRGFFELGFALRFGWTPIKILNWPAGLEFQTSYHYLSAQLNETGYSSYKIRAQVIDLKLSGVWDIPVFSRFFVNLRAGGGITILADVYLEESMLVTPPKSGWIPSLGVGASFRAMIFSSFFVDFGLDFLYIFSVDNPPPVYLMPALMIGFKL
ncbi:MAG: hypothetical protein LBC77_08635 [Spirochaetaceae bacterium]|jgi:hypothetical protein|nr:hypothetical protein [Spirochaetaceae bacterium]